MVFQVLFQHFAQLKAIDLNVMIMLEILDPILVTQLTLALLYLNYSWASKIDQVLSIISIIHVLLTDLPFNANVAIF